VTEQDLDGADVSRRPVDHRCLRASERVSAVLFWTQTDRSQAIGSVGRMKAVLCGISPIVGGARRRKLRS
jgi:hypothetical protein